MTCALKAQQPPTSPLAGSSSAIDFHPAFKPQQSSRDEPTSPFQVPDGGKATNAFNRPQTYCCPNRDAAALINANVLSVRQAAGFPSAR